MSKPRDYDKIHLQNLSVIKRKIESIFKKAAEEAAKIGVSIRQPLKDNRIFSFDDYPETQKHVDKLLKSLHESMEITIVNGVRSSWTLSNNKNSALASRVFGKHVKDLSKEQYRRYFSTNGAALDAFLKRKEKGLNLSDRVWKYTGAFKNEIELGLDLGIRSGESAAKMTRSLTQYLQYPDKLFRRVRDEHGILQLSKAAKAFHPGTGVYRSSYKNALRLAVTETNIAYRTSDYLRWQQMDFVVGIEIRMSNNHPIEDICDELAGRYPKDFKFTGWHPFCRCHVVPVLKTEEEMDKDTQRILDGEEPLPGSINGVKDVPSAFGEWITNNSERIKAAEAKGTVPYFIADNAKYTEPNLKPNIETSYANQQERIAKQELKRALKAEDDKMDLTKILGTVTDEEQQLVADFIGRELQDLAVGNTTEVPTKQLRSVQNSVFGKIVDKYVKIGNKGDLPYIVQIDGEHYIVDGNHRVVAEIIKGKAAVMASVNVMPNKVTELLRKLKTEDEDAYWDLITGIGDTDSFIEKAKAVIAPKKTALQIVDERQGYMKRGNYGAAMKLGRSATKEAMKIVENIGAPELTEAQKKNILELADALGAPRKGIKPMTFLDADQGASNPTKSDSNCQSVVVAFSARRRGMNCSALPYDDENKAQNYLMSRFNEAWLITDRKGQQKFAPITMLRGKSDDEAIAKLKKQLTVDGEYVLGINYKKRPGEEEPLGHVLSIIRKKGEVIIHDEQQSSERKRYLNIDSFENIDYFELIRIDKAILNIRLAKHVLRF